MTDPFDALREPVVPTDPDPDFAASLRARIERALALPRGVAVTSTLVEHPPTAALGAAIPSLAVPTGSGRRALDGPQRAFALEHPQGTTVYGVNRFVMGRP